MTIEERTYRVAAYQELERDIEELENREKVKKEMLDEKDVFIESGIINNNILFALRLNLLDIDKAQELRERLAKINKSKQNEFRELVINPFDDVITSRERLANGRIEEKKSLDDWQAEIHARKSIQAGASSSSAAELNDEEKTR